MFWHDQQTNTLIYDTPDAAKVVAAIPAARKLHNGFVAVPAQPLFNLQMLRWLGFPVVPPMMDNYDWPRSVRTIPAPFRAQILTANFLALHPKALVLSDMGTGKTLALLWAADFLMQQHPPGTFRFLVNAPLSTLQRVWGDSIFKHFMNRRSYVILHGSADRRRKLLAEPHDFYIINHDGLGTGVKVGRRQLELTGFAADLATRTDIRGAIFDEISAYRNNTERHKVARGFLANRDVIWGASGTPTPNAPTDAWGIAKLINDAFGETKTSFQARTMYRLTQFKWVPARGSAQEARKILSPSIRFSLDECADIPESTTTLYDVEMSAAQRKDYDILRRDAHLVIGTGVVSPANEAVLRGKLIQIACGAVYSGKDQTRAVHRLDCGPRIKVLKEIIEQAGHKIIIFAPLTSVVSMLYDELKDWSREVIGGPVTRKQRDDIFQRFQDEADPHLLIAHPDTMSHGLNLTAARTIVWYAPTDKTESYLQANRRIRRPGQIHRTNIVQLASTATEREIYKRIEANQSLQGVMLTLIQGNDADVYRRHL